jgi:hypothetical protein
VEGFEPIDRLAKGLFKKQLAPAENPDIQALKVINIKQ